MFSLDYNSNSYYGAFVEVDKILLDDMFGTAKLRPYLGGVAGYMNFDTDELNLPSELEDSELYEETNGFYFGGNFGFIIYATDNIDVDISYHYYKVQNLDFLDDLHGASFGAHYFF
jgi:opacity protein-like surface antigen